MLAAQQESQTPARSCGSVSCRSGKSRKKSRNRQTHEHSGDRILALLTSFSVEQPHLNQVGNNMQLVAFTA
jgi:hypothetical protein